MYIMSDYEDFFEEPFEKKELDENGLNRPDEETPQEREERNIKVLEEDVEDVYVPESHRIIEKPKKKPRKKVEMTPERKQKLLENLKKGRLTAQKNRQKRAEYNKILKEKERKKIDDVLEEDYKRRNNKKNVETENERLSKEIEELKKKLSIFTNKEDVEKLKKDLNLVEDKKELKEVKKEFSKKLIEQKTEQNVTMELQKPKKIISNRIKKGSIWKL
jgi:trichohyalin